MAKKLKLKILKDKYSVIQLPKDSKIPEWVNINDNFISITRSDEELSIICKSSCIPENSNLKQEKNWIIIKIDEILDFSLAGVLFSMIKILKENLISIFTVSTYNTDYILIKNDDMDKTVGCLSENYEIIK